MVSGAKEGVRPRHLRSHDSTIEMNGGKTGSRGPGRGTKYAEWTKWTKRLFLRSNISI